jgi:pimeloyl-ACP methyl ester carboxylesterase
LIRAWRGRGRCRRPAAWRLLGDTPCRARAHFGWQRKAPPPARLPPRPDPSPTTCLPPRALAGPARQAKEASLRDNSVLNALPRSRNRLLVFAGTRDRVVPVRNAAVIADPVPGSWVLRFADEGHGLPFEDPKSVIYLSAEFWGFAVPLQEGDFEGLKYGVLASAAPPASRNATAAGLRATVPAPAAAAAASKADARLLPMLKPKAAPPAGGAPG